MLIDSHCHLHLIDYEALGIDLNALLKAARENHVEHMLCVATSLQEADTLFSLVEPHEFLSASIGLHPTEKVAKEPTLEELHHLASHPKVIAVGETGLDAYRSEEDLPYQIDRFARHIAVARQLQKPLIVHTRKARKETLEVLKSEKAYEVGGVLHCFTEDWETAVQAVDLGFYISFSGILTFKNALELQEIAKRLPLDKILIETDAPYLAPVPYRGKINQPAYVKEVALCLAKLRDLSFEEVAYTTTQNFYQLFLQKAKAGALVLERGATSF